jgi:hypothetical protein
MNSSPTTFAKVPTDNRLRLGTYIGIITLAIIWIIAGIAKLIFPVSVFEVIELILRPRWALPAAHGIGVVEILIGLAILAPSSRFAGLIGSVCLSGSFIILSLWAMQTSWVISCGCFGALTSNELGIETLPLQVLVFVLSALSSLTRYERIQVGT